MQVSLFNGLMDKNPKPITIREVVEIIRADQRLQVLTENHRRYRAVGDTARADAEKQHMPCFSVAVQFSGGKQQKHIVSYTGLSIVDLDHIPSERMAEVLEMVRGDEHTLVAYTTISGEGIRVIARFAFTTEDSESRECLHRADKKSLVLYTKVFAFVNSYYENLTGLLSDEKCKNATRISGMAHDPDVYYNPDAVPIVVDMTKKSVGRPKGVKSEKLRVKSCKVSDVEATVLRELERRGVVYEAGNHNKYISDACYMMNRYGVPESECLEWALEKFADYQEKGHNIEGIVSGCYTNVDEHGTARLPKNRSSEERSNYATVAEIQDWLTERGVQIRHNVITGKREVMNVNENQPSGREQSTSASMLTLNWKELTDRHVNSLYRAFSIDTGKRLRISDLFIIIESDFYPEYHPMRDFLESLPTWDGTTDYIDGLASRVHVTGCTQELHNRFFKKWFVAMVAAWIVDGVTNHEILTYIGPQGIYKSTFMRLLLPPTLRSYFSARNFANRMTKDDRLELTEMALIALEELDHMKLHELNQLKAITTDPTVNERAAYARYRERREHIASFCGTGNNAHFLTDLTSNRRWLPFMVESIDSPYDTPIDYVGLYAQAYTLWQQGFRYWFDDAENAELEVHNQNFEEPNLELELIQTYFRPPRENEVGEFYTASRIIETICVSVKTPLYPRNIAIWMNKLGYRQRRRDNMRGWNVILLTATDIKQRQQENARLSTPE